MQNLKVTLYDLFGYLCPGLVFLTGLAIAFWALFLPAAPARLPELSAPVWTALLVVAYLTGDLLHSLYPVIVSDKRLASAVSYIFEHDLAAPVVAAARKKLKALADIDVDDPQLIFQLCDEFLLQQGIRDNQEIYLYRDGFYRGMSLSCLLLTIALVVRALSAPALVALPSGIYAITPGMFVFLWTTFASAAVLFHLRHVRFLKYRVGAAIDGFLAMKPERE